MKFFCGFMILFILNSSCKTVYKPQFSIGNCIVNDNNGVIESWENKKRSTYYHKILKIGVSKYLVLTLSPTSDKPYLAEHEFFYDDIMTKVSCPKELENN